MMYLEEATHHYIIHANCVYEFYVHVTMHRNKFLYNKTNQMHQFPQIYSDMNYMFRAVPLLIIRSLFTLHSALVYVIQVFFRAGPGWSSSKAVYKPV